MEEERDECQGYTYVRVNEIIAYRVKSGQYGGEDIYRRQRMMEVFNTRSEKSEKPRMGKEKRPKRSHKKNYR